MSDGFWWFYLFGAPYFFSDRFGLGLKARGAPVAVIYVLASVGSIGGGWLSGWFMKIGWSVNRARKTTLFICAACVLPVFFAAITSSYWLAVALIAIAASAHQAWSANVYSLAGDMFPRRMVGSVTGLAGFAGSVGGLILFILIAHVRTMAEESHDLGNYRLIFLAASLAYVTGAVIVQLLAPKLEPVEFDQETKV
jgi:ACS family hexuronate transporter-like MFS transporter